jgi:hypothetical protein
MSKDLKLYIIERARKPQSKDEFTQIDTEVRQNIRRLEELRKEYGLKEVPMETMFACYKAVRQLTEEILARAKKK